MLIQLTIRNFAIVHTLDVDFQQGMTVITGETGAGKSIAIDALGLCLGQRADVSLIGQGAERADIGAHFSLHDTPSALQWLQEHDLDDKTNECLLRRVISSDGRSRGFINGIPATLSQLKALGSLLIQIHGQHTHQNLLKSDHQKTLLDAFMEQTALLTRMKLAYRHWKEACQQLQKHQEEQEQRTARQQLLDYQLEELEQFAPQDGEYDQMESEYQRLSNRGQLLSLSQQAQLLLADQEEYNAQQLLTRVQLAIREITQLDPALQHLESMLQDAMIQIDEIHNELRNYNEQIEDDPERQHQLEQRLSQQLALARKHQIKPTELSAHYQSLQQESAYFSEQEHSLSTLKQSVIQFHQEALDIANQLHKLRVKYAQQLAQQVTKHLHQLAMPHSHFEINVTENPDLLTAEGYSKVQFRVTANSGEILQPLDKVASGGELSRIALAIQVITAQKMETPTLIFDEIDTGISGSTAAVVGSMLRHLGISSQVLCVTHLPQVASSGEHHFCVIKLMDHSHTHTQMQQLNTEERIEEIARLLGGQKITANTLANAKELLLSA